jgi:cytochrome c
MKKELPALIGLGLAVLFSGTGCSDPDRAILARLDASGRARFESGRRVSTPCWTCHDLAGTVKKVGPSLLGLYGRRSGQAPGYVGSDAMRAASIVWDDRMLGAFLSDPGGFVPGNRMVSPGLRDPAALSDLLFYLRLVTRPGAREAGAFRPPARISTLAEALSPGDVTRGLGKGDFRHDARGRREGHSPMIMASHPEKE